MKNPLFLICFVLLALVFNSCKSDDELLSPVSIGEEEFSLYVDQKIIYVESEDTTRKFEYKEYCNSHMYNARGARYMKNPSNWLDAYGIFVDKAFPLTDKDYYSHIYIRRDGSEKIIFPRIDVTLTDAAPETIENASGNVLEFIG